MVQIPYTAIGVPKVSYVEHNGANFKIVEWEHAGEYKGQILYVHGFAEDSTIYTEFFDKLSQKGYNIYFFDQRGSGETSPGKQVGKTDEFHTFNDLDFMLKRLVDAQTKPEQLYLFGHSMGGGIILNYAIRGKYRDHIRAVVASAPMVTLHPNTQPNFIVRALSPVINRLAPNLKIDSKLNIDYVTSNKKWQQYIREHDQKLIGTSRLFFDMFARGEALTKPEYVSKFLPDIALLLLHGTDDSINHYDGSRKFYSLLSDNVDKEFVDVKEARHSLFIEKDEILIPLLDKILDFLSKH